LRSLTVPTQVLKFATSAIYLVLSRFPFLGLTGQDYGLSGWTLFRCEGGQVPDGGTTVMLLGAALGALGMARRFLKS
jgi:hypothetical protein